MFHVHCMSYYVWTRVTPGRSYMYSSITNIFVITVRVNGRCLYDRSADGEHDGLQQDRLGGGEATVHVCWPGYAPSHDELVQRISVHLEEQHLWRIRGTDARRSHQHIGGTSSHPLLTCKGNNTFINNVKQVACKKLGYICMLEYFFRLIILFFHNTYIYYCIVYMVKQ